MLYAVMTLPQEWIISETFFVFVCFQALPWQPVGIWHHCWQPFSSRFLCDPWRHPLWPQSAPLHPSSCCIAISNFILPSNNCTWETVKMAPAVVLYSFVGSAACSGECHTSDLDMATPDAVTLCRPSAFSSLWGRCIVLQPSRLSGVLVSSFSPVPWQMTLCRPSARSHGGWPCVVLQPGPMGIDVVSLTTATRWPQELSHGSVCVRPDPLHTVDLSTRVSALLSAASPTEQWSCPEPLSNLTNNGTMKLRCCPERLSNMTLSKLHFDRHEKQQKRKTINSIKGVRELN